MLTRQAIRAIHGPEGRRGEEVDVVAEQRVVSVAARDHGVAGITGQAARGAVADEDLVPQLADAIADLQAADRLDPLLAAAAHIDLGGPSVSGVT
jgi:hypothetical protein